MSEDRSDLEARAADGDAGAMFNLGSLAHKAGDVETARAWWEKAADAGNPDAMLKLGTLASYAGDIETSRAWYEKGAEAGHGALAHSFLHLLEEETRYQRWLEKATDVGSEDAKVALEELDDA